MKTQSGILLFLGILTFCLLVAREDVDYQHPELIAALQEEGIKDVKALEEIVLSDSLYITQVHKFSIHAG